MNITEALKKSNHVRRKIWEYFYISAVNIPSDLVSTKSKHIVLYSTNTNAGGYSNEWKPSYQSIMANDWIDASDVHADFMKRLGRKGK